MTVATREPQYSACFDEPPVTLGPMAGSTWRWDPKRLGFMLARYKFVAKMLDGHSRVAEIGCADGFGSVVVSETVGGLDLYDFDPAFVAEAAKLHLGRVAQHDVTDARLPRAYDAIYMLDVIEHLRPEQEPHALQNICHSLKRNGTFIVGAPSLESQVHARPISRAGHVNCKSGEQFRADLRKHFANVFLFGMNDEVVHTGFPPMCHYLLALCTGPL